jgi:hypothetical protein
MGQRTPDGPRLKRNLEVEIFEVEGGFKVQATLIGDGSMEQRYPWLSNLVSSRALLFTGKQRNFINVS